MLKINIKNSILIVLIMITVIANNYNLYWIRFACFFAIGFMFQFAEYKVKK